MKLLKATLAICVFVTAMYICPQRAAAQYFLTDNTSDELFRYEVKIIDEFIERFNDDPGSYLRQTYQKEKKPFNRSRAYMVASLFNATNKEFTTDTSINGFFRTVLDSAHPQLLKFSDADWYAQVKGIFKYNKRQIEIPLIFHIKAMPDNSVKCMIAGIGDSTASSAPQATISLGSRKSKHPIEFISTPNYNTNFADLYYIFTGDIKTDLFFEPEALATTNGKNFLNMLNSNKLIFQYTKDVTYHFFQVPGWVFTVSQFNRKTMNSGWLISDVKMTSEATKNELRKNLLYR